MKKKWVALVPLVLVGFLVFIAIGGQVVMWLWNWLTPALFGWPQVTFWQALALLALCRILFGGWSGGRPVRSRVRERMSERWQTMTPEERERFRQRFRGRWTSDEPPATDPTA